MKRLVSILLAAVVCFGASACSLIPGLGGLINADILAYSYNRMEGADLTFNMSMKSSAINAAAPAAEGMGAARRTAVGATPLGVSGDRFIIENEEGTSDGLNFFYQYDELLESTRSEAREIVDFALSEITVIGQLVRHEMTQAFYLLQYSASADVVTVYKFFRPYESSGGGKGDGMMGVAPNPDSDRYSTALMGNKITGLTRVSFYYDENGYETVEYYTYNITAFEGVYTFSSTEIVYTPGQRYVIKQYLCNFDPIAMTVDEDSETVNYTAADRATGKWQGLSMQAEKDDPYLTGEGTYQSSKWGPEFLMETDAGIFFFITKLYPYRDGACVTDDWGDDADWQARPTDEIRMMVDSVSNEAFAAVTYTDGAVAYINLLLANMAGWTEVVLNPPDPDYPYHIYYNEEGEYIQLSNGDRIDVGWMYWHLDHGYIRNYFDENDQSMFEFEDGTVHTWDWFVENVDLNRAMQLGQAESPINGETGKATGLYWMLSGAMSYTDMNARPADTLGVVSKFLAEKGLTVKGFNTRHLFNLTSALASDAPTYMNRIYKSRYGSDWSAAAMAETLYSEAAASREFAASLNGFFDNYEVISSFQLPKLPGDFATISLGGRLTGGFTVTEAGFNFSAMQAAVAKSILLGDQNEYGIAAVLTGTGGTYEIAGAFESQRYANADMTISGRTSAPIPSLEVGEYELLLYFGKKTEAGYAKISDTVSAALTSFTPFTVEREDVGGYFRYTFAKSGDSLRVTVTYVDEQAPTITLENATENGGNTYLAFGAGATVADLLSFVQAEDNRDGILVLTEDNVALKNGGTDLTLTSPLTNGGCYQITVRDAQGNEASVEVYVAIASE